MATETTGKQIHHAWSEDEVRILKELYPTTMDAAEIAERLHLKTHAVYNKAAQLGLHKPKESYILHGKQMCNHPASIATRYQSGHNPLNKGKKMRPETYEKLRGTMYQKGNIPANHREVGSERVNVDGYIEIKVAEPSGWRLKQRYVWEQAYGKIPRGYNVQFKNHDTQDCRLENLYLISRADQLKNENSMFARYPKELQDVMRLKGVIKRKIRERNEQLEFRGVKESSL